MPDLSVLMPAYNAERTISAAVTSTLRALPRSAELVVLNDASTDGTLARLGEIEDSRLRVISSAVSLGGGGARNRLFAATDSRYVAAMDADDVCLPWRFRVQRTALARGLDVVFGAAVRFGSSFRNLGIAGVPGLNSGDSRVHLLFLNPFFHPTAFGTRTSFESSGLYADMRVAQDYEFWMRLVLNNVAIGRTSVPVLLYRLHGTQISASAQYAERVRSSETLRETYSALLRAVSPRTAHSLATKETLDDNALEQFYRELLAELAGKQSAKSRLLRTKVERNPEKLTPSLLFASEST